MFKIVRRIARGAVVAIATPALFSLRSGHWRSAFAGRAVDAAGEALPWLTYPAIEFLKRLDLSDASVLEFGGGQSTIWFSRHARRVVTLEDRPQWAAHVRALAAANAIVVDSPRVPEIATARQHGPFDLVVVDGLNRQAAARIAAEIVAPDGLVIIDNADDYAGVLTPFEQAGFLRIDFVGLPPANWRNHCTALFFRGDCKFMRHISPAAVA